MLDDLRNAAILENPDEDPNQGSRKSGRSARSRKQFLGMSASQRFVVAIMLVLLILVLAVMCLVVTGKFWI